MQAFLITLQDPIVETRNPILAGNLRCRTHTRQEPATATATLPLLLSPVGSREPRTQPWWRWTISLLKSVGVFFRISSPWIELGMTCIEVFEVVDFFTYKWSDCSSCPYGDWSSHWQGVLEQLLRFFYWSSGIMKWCWDAWSWS